MLKVISVLLVAVLLVGLMSSCFFLPKKEIPEVEEKVTEQVVEEKKVVENIPTIPAVEEEEEEYEEEEDLLPDGWVQTRMVEFRSITLSISTEWVQKDQNGIKNFYYVDGADRPRVSLYSDYVSWDGEIDLDEFFEWWLAERFYNPQYNPNPDADLLKNEFVVYNGVRGLEISYIDESNANIIYRHNFYTVINNYFTQVSFNCDAEGYEEYLDDVEYIYGSIHLQQYNLAEWPDYLLPKNTPVFPGNDIEVHANFTVESPPHISLQINGYTREDVLNYVASLKKAHWTMEIESNDVLNYSGKKGTWTIHIDPMGSDILLIDFTNTDGFW